MRLFTVSTADFVNRPGFFVFHLHSPSSRAYHLLVGHRWFSCLLHCGLCCLNSLVPICLPHFGQARRTFGGPPKVLRSAAIPRAISVGLISGTPTAARTAAHRAYGSRRK